MPLCLYELILVLIATLPLEDRDFGEVAQIFNHFLIDDPQGVLHRTQGVLHPIDHRVPLSHPTAVILLKPNETRGNFG